jgi:hypothetical protein
MIGGVKWALTLEELTVEKKARLLLGGLFCNKGLAISYFHMATCHTIIGVKRFHFRVRDGIGWFTLAMFTKQTGLAVVSAVIDYHWLSLID